MQAGVQRGRKGKGGRAKGGKGERGSFRAARVSKRRKGKGARGSFAAARVSKRYVLRSLTVAARMLSVYGLERRNGTQRGVAAR